MTEPGQPQLGRFFEQHAEELTRIWRMARITGRAHVFPGLLDDVVARFFAHAARLLERQEPPEALWRELVGLVRWPPRVAPEELADEWTLLGELLAATSEALDAPPETRRWLDEALAACAAGTAQLGQGGERPRGIVTALMLSPASPQPHTASAGTG